MNTLFQEDVGTEEKGQVLRHEKDEYGVSLRKQGRNQCWLNRGRLQSERTQKATGWSSM